MVQPFDYTMAGVVDPVLALQSGMAFGQQQRMNEQGMDMNAQQMDLLAQQEARNQTAFGQQNLLFDQGQQDRAAQQAAAQAMNADLVALSEKVAAGHATVADFSAVGAKYPDLADEMSKMWEGQTAERKSADVAELFKGVMAIKAGRPDLAIKMLEDRATAAENSGDAQEAEVTRAMAAAIKADPNAGLTSLGLLLHSVDADAATAALGEAPEMTASQKDYTFYADQETAAGRKPLSFNEWDLQGKKAGAASTTIDLGTGEATTGQAVKATQMAATTAVAAIDEIMNDPALPGVTGALEGGGGNDVDQFSMGRRAYYGDAGLGIIQKIAQLQNTAWLAARDMLKGGGAITDFESRKAEGAMARLSRAQGDKEFKAALTDLRNAITDGERKLREAGLLEGAADPGSPPAGGLTQEELDALMLGP